MAHFSSKNRYLHFTSTFDQLQTCSTMFIYPFRTFDEHFTRTVLLLLTKAKVQKIPCDQLSVNMAARQMFGTRDLV